jgi:hypothetical protein
MARISVICLGVFAAAIAHAQSGTGELGSFNFDGSNPTSGLVATGAPVISTLNSHTPPHSLLFPAGNNYEAYTLPSATSTLYTRQYIDISSIGSTSNDFLRLYHGSSQLMSIFLNSSSGHPSYYNQAAGATTTMSSTSFPTGSIHLVELYVKMSATAGQVICKIDDATVYTSAATLNTGTSTIDTVWFGQIGNTAPVGWGTTYMDNVDFSAINWIGPINPSSGTGELGSFNFDGSNPTSGLVATGAPVVSTLNSHTPPHSLSFPAGNNYETYTLPSATSVLYTRQYIDITSTGSTSNAFLRLYHGSSELMSIFLNSPDGHPSYYNQATGATTTISSTSFPSGSIHLVELYTKISATAGQVICKIDGTTVYTSAATLNTGTSTIDTVWFGQIGNTAPVGWGTTYMDNVDFSANNWIGPINAAAAPVFSPTPGSYTTAQVVSLTDSTAGANIYYTTDGTTPTSASSLYTQAINVGSTETIQAIAIAPNYANSTITSGNYTIVSPPTLSGLSPTSGVVGTSVTISGSNFGASQGTSIVSFNGATATPTSWSASSIVVPAPTGATTGNVVVTVGGASSNGSLFTVVQALCGQCHPPNLTLSCTATTIVPPATTQCTAKLPATATGTVSMGTYAGDTKSVQPDWTGAATQSNLLESASAGTHTFTASYPGDNYWSAASASVTLTVQTGSTYPNMTLTCTPTDNGTVQPATCSAQLTAGSTGYVAFTDGTFYSFALINPSGQAAISTEFVGLANGTYNISASYGGDGTYGSAVASANVVVNGGTPSTESLASQVTVTCTPSTVVVPQTGTCTAQVPVGATGTVAFTYGINGQYQTVVPVDGTGDAATYNMFIGASAGSNSVTARYSGDSAYAPSTASTSVTVVQAGTNPGTVPYIQPPTIAMGCNSPIGAGGAAECTAWVSPGATGYILYYSNANGRTVAEPIDSSGYTDALDEVSNVPPGSYYVSASYGGDQTYASGWTWVAVDVTAIGISGISPTSGAVGTVVTISGSGFGASQGSSTVSLNGIPASPTSWSDTSITVPVPGGASTGPFTVTAAGAQAVSPTFTVQQSPFITAISPTSGPAGTVVTITGIGFASAPGPATVDFNGIIPASYVSWSSTSIQVAVPEGATSGNVYVTASNVSSNGVPFIVTKQTPTITWAQPAPIQSGTALSSAQLNATATIAGTFTYSPVAGTVPPVGANTLTVTFTPSDSVDYNTATATVTLQVVGDSAIISTIAGTGTAGFSGDGAALSIELNTPGSIARDSSGNLYFADISNHRVRKLTISTGSITTIAGNGSLNYDGDGGLATSAGLGYPSSIAVDSAGNVYIGDIGANDQNVTQGGVRMVSATTGTISTIASYSFETETPMEPIDLSFNNSGTLYINDQTYDDVLMFNPATGSVLCIVGSHAVEVNGVAAGACTFPVPGGSGQAIKRIAFDPQGHNLYFTTGPSIFQINAAGLLSNIAGTGTAGPDSGDYGPASAAVINASAMATDVIGNVYFADNQTRIREIVMASGQIVPVAGNGTLGYFGNHVPALTAEMNDPIGIITDAADDIIFTDSNNNIIREVGATKVTPTLTLTANPQSVPFGSTATFTATVINGANPTGNVTFQIDGTPFGTVSLNNATATYNGSNEAWTIGNHTITAVYSGDSNNASASTGITFSVSGAPPPQIYGILADPAAIGTQVTISGDGFGWTQGTSTVSFNGVAATPISWSPTAIVVTVPAGATTGNVIVIVGGNPSNAYLFMVSGSCSP